MSAKNIGKYTLDDSVQILTKAMDAVAGEEKAFELATNYLKWINENYWHRYDQLNLQIAAQAQKYIAKLRAKQTRDKAMQELIEERNALIDDCEHSRAELGLSIIVWENNPDPEFNADEVRKKYGLEVQDERDIKIPLEFEEVRTIGGSSQSADSKFAYPVVDVQGWFRGGHQDRNITQQDLDRWTDELVELLEEPIANNAKIAMRTEKEVIARKATYDAVSLFKEGWEGRRSQIINYKNNLLCSLLLKRQIQNIRQMIGDLLEDIKSRAKDDVTGIFRPNPLADDENGGDQPQL